MAKNRNTAAKRSREVDKKRKAIDKIERRRQRRETDPPPAQFPDSASDHVHADAPPIEPEAIDSRTLP